jgi:DNA-binding GntR family transcriptional regulator
VADPSLEHLRELSLIEAALRGVSARLAAERATDEDRRAIRAKFDELDARLDRAGNAGVNRDQLRLATQLHALIDSAARSETLSDMIATASAFDQSFRARHSKALYASRAVIPERHDQHGTIVDAVVAGDGAEADAAMRDHILTARQAFLDVLDQPTED